MGRVNAPQEFPAYQPPAPKVIEIDPPIPGPFLYVNPAADIPSPPCVPTPFVSVSEVKCVPPVITEPTIAFFQKQEEVKPELGPEFGLGRKLKAGDIVDGDSLPASGKSWNPDPKHKTVRWFDSRWKADGDYELVNYCVFPTHLELELRRL